MPDNAITHNEALQLFTPFQPYSHLLLAVSGGSDSIAMMHLAHSVGGLKLSSATVNHGLRAEALSEAELVVNLAAQLNIPHVILKWQGEKPITSLQERARDARYELLFGHARTIGASHVLTAHTLDDQAETILFRMARGSSLTGLIGMKAHVVHGDIIHSRPLLSVPKQRLVDTCEAYNLCYVEDISNTNTQFARIRMRALMPQLAKEGLNATRFAQLSRRANRIDEALEARVDQLMLPIGANIYDCNGILNEPPEIILRYLLRVIRKFHEPAFIHVRLSSVEAVLDDFCAALTHDKIWKRSLAGLVLQLNRRKVIKIVIDPRKL